MAAVNRVYAARLVGMVVLGPDGESLGRVRDVVISISIVRQQPRVLGLVVELLTRRRIFVPILRITAIDPGAVTLTTGSVSLRRFAQRPNEVLVLGQVIETTVSVVDPDLPQLSGIDVSVVDLGIEPTRTRDWMVTKVAVRPPRRLARRSNVHIVDWQHVHGLTPSGLAMPDQGVAQLLDQFEGQRAVEVADAILELPEKRRYEVVNALDDERLADVLQELPEDEQADMLKQLPTERAADVLEAMDPDDAADLLGSMTPSDAEQFLRRMDPEDSEDVRRLLSHSPDTAGGLMTSEPVVLAPDTTVAEALARVRDPDLTPALASLVFVTRSPTATPTGHYLGCVHLQRLLREPPADLVSGIIDTDLPNLSPEDSLSAVTRYFAAYNLVCGPVVDEQNHLLGAVSVDDLLDHLLPDDWREREEPELFAPRGRHERLVGTSAPGHPTGLPSPLRPESRPRGGRQFLRVHRALPGNGTLPGVADDDGDRLDSAESVRREAAMGSVSVHSAESRVLHAGRVCGAAHPACAESTGKPRPRVAGRRPSTGRADQGRHRVSGP